MNFKRITAPIAALALCIPAALPVHAAEQENKAYTQHETLSCIGSVSKMFAAIAVMQLVDAGKVELDAPVTDYLPEFRMASGMGHCRL